MIKGIDYIGAAVVFFCHDGAGNFVMHRRSDMCRDERGRWDFGGGGLKFGEKIEAALEREVLEEYGTKPVSFEYLGLDECFREDEGKDTHWLVFRYKVLVNREEVVNNEPDKHEELGWFTLDALPAPLHSNLPRELEVYGDQLRG